MPKVNDEYFYNKRKNILDAAIRVFLKKPSYSVNMVDIVKESKLSQGGVYKYYSNIDDIIIALLNSNNITLSPKDVINKYYDNPEKVIFELFENLKKNFFIDEKCFGKIMFELMPIFLNDKDRFKKLIQQISKNNSFYYWISELFVFIDKKVDEKYFNPVLKLNDIYIQIIFSIEGLFKELILIKYYGFDKRFYRYGENNFLEINLNNLFNTLYETILILLGSRNNFTKSN